MSTPERVRLLRFRRGLSAARLARMVRVSQSQFSRYEQGKAIPGPVLARLADMLETSTDYLLCRTDDPRPWEDRASRVKVDLPPGLGLTAA